MKHRKIKTFCNLSKEEVQNHPEYEGEVILDGEVYEVRPETSYGYADKNWGGDYTSPWLWLGGSDLKSRKTGLALNDSAFDFGGGRPKVLGVALSRKLLGALVYEGKKYEYNFSKFWLRSSIEFSFEEKEEENTWILKGKNKNSLLIMEVSCKREDMLQINYVSPDGEKRHNRLWNGGTATGTIQLFDIRGGKQILVDEIMVEHVGCEYGEYEELNEHGK